MQPWALACLCRDETCPIWSRSFAAVADAASLPTCAAYEGVAGLLPWSVALPGHSLWESWYVLIS